MHATKRNRFSVPRAIQPQLSLCVFGVRAGGTIEMDCLVINWPCLLPPPKRQIFPLISVATNRAAILSPGQFAKH